MNAVPVSNDLSIVVIELIEVKNVTNRPVAVDDADVMANHM